MAPSNNHLSRPGHAALKVSSFAPNFSMPKPIIEEDDDEPGFLKAATPGVSSFSSGYKY
jgi:hypothetical protein